MPDFNSVPLGRANSGAAVEFGAGLGALHYLQNTDALNARLAERRRGEAVRQQQAAARDFAQRLQLSEKGGLTYMPQLQTKAQGVYAKMQELASAQGLSPQEKATRQQQLRDQYNREAEASAQADKYVGELAQKITADKRYNRDATWNLLHGTQYKDGQLLSPLEYDPRSADAALGTGRTHLNGVEIMRQFAAADPHPDSVTYNVEAMPGGKGSRRTATSDFYELTQDGKILRDTKTNLPVVKATPEALARFERDPVNRQYLDSFEAEHQQELASATEKMQNYQELTPAEAATVAREQSPAGRRLDLFKNLLTEQAYGRESTTLTNKAAPRPTKGSAGSKPKFTVSGGENYTPGVLGGTGAMGTQGIAHFGASDPLRRTTSSGEVKPYSANATHGTYLVMSPDGASQMVVNNSAPQQLDYDAPVVLLRRPNGAVFLPTDPKILAAAKQGDDGPLLEWARTEKAKNPTLRAEPFMLAAQSKKADLDVSSIGAAYEGLKREQDRYVQSVAGPGTALGEALSKEGASTEELNGLLSGMGKAYRMKSEDELRGEARKLVQQQNATLAIPYSGQEKIRIDANTGYLMRKDNSRRAKALQAQVDRVNRSIGSAAPAAKPANAGRGPLAGQVVKPAAVKVAPAVKAPAAPAPAANKFGFKFKQK